MLRSSILTSYLFLARISLDKKLKDQSMQSTAFLYFSLLHHKSTEWKTYSFRRFFSLHVQNWRFCLSVLFMKFPTRDIEKSA